MDNTLADSKFLWLYKGLVLIAMLKNTLTAPTQFLCAVYSKLYPNSSLYCSLKHSYQCLWINTRELITRYSERDLLFPRRYSASTSSFGVQNSSNYAWATVRLGYALFSACCYVLCAVRCCSFLKDSSLTGHCWSMYTMTVILPLWNLIFLPPMPTFFVVSKFVLFFLAACLLLVK